MPEQYARLSLAAFDSVSGGRMWPHLNPHLCLIRPASVAMVVLLEQRRLKAHLHAKEGAGQPEMWRESAATLWRAPLTRSSVFCGDGVR